MKETRKENVVLVNYRVESEAYQALSELKRESVNANYTISQAMIVKRVGGRLSVMDGFVNGGATGDDTWRGGLLGGLIGILGGPIGVLLGGSVGMLVGGAVDAGKWRMTSPFWRKRETASPTVKRLSSFWHRKRMRPR